MIRDFLKSSQHILAQDGEIDITLKTSAPYDKWTFPDFAQYEIEPKYQHNFHAELFPGYVHRSTNRIGNTRVKNGLAKTYLFSKRRKQREDESEIAEDETFSVSTPFNLSIQFSPVDDDDVKVFVKEVLALASLRDMKIDVLDIRRHLPEAIRPDTRQLNRVLYQMKKSKMLKKLSPKSCNQKPTWKLIAC